MAVTLTGTGGLFTRLGKLAHALDTINTARGSTIPTEVVDAIATGDSDSDPAIRQALAPLLSALSNGQASLGGLASVIQQAARELLIRQVHADNPLPELTELAALNELIRQVTVAGDYVAANTLSATVTKTGLDGDGELVLSTKDERGRPLENLIAEDLECRCLGGSAGSESIELRGEAPITDRLHWQYPAGSGARRTITLVNPASPSNLLANGSFEAWESSAATGWTADTGSFGTHWIEEASTVYAGDKALELVGNGSTLAAISQDITAKLSPLTQYGFCIWIRRDGSAAGAGALVVDLYDGSSVIDDAAGSANSLSIDLTALTTSWVAYTGTFRLPTTLPSTVKLRLRLSTALTNGRSVFLDHAGLARMVPVATNNPGETPRVCGFSGSSPFTVDDYTHDSRVFTVTTANDLAGKWQLAYRKFFNMSASGLLLPTSGSGSEISESLIA